MIEHLSIKVHGQVQGVFFRHSAKMTAKGLGLVGFVRNESGGTVYLEAEGKKEPLEKLLQWCHHGPPSAQVEKITFKYASQLKYFSDFEIV